MTSLHAPVRPGREIPRIYRDIVNKLVDQGWEYRPGTGNGGKGDVVPPDPAFRPTQVPNTPSDRNGHWTFIRFVRRAGAVLDDELIGTQKRRDSRRRLHKARAREVTVEVHEDVQPVTTHGAWWRPVEPEPPTPEPVPEPVVVAPRPVGPDPDARGTAWTLGQARMLLREGYHVRKVISKTGWGINHFRDLIDETGYVRTD